MRTTPRIRRMLDGQRYGILLILDEAPRRAQHRYRHSRCDRGQETILAQNHRAHGAAIRGAARRRRRAYGALQMKP